jgi:hypothetical protein
MQLPTPKQKANGKWLIQVMVDGQRVSKQFDTEDEALYWAAGIKTKQQEAEQSAKTISIGAAIDRYIESKSSVLPLLPLLAIEECKSCGLETLKKSRFRRSRRNKFRDGSTSFQKPTLQKLYQTLTA